MSTITISDPPLEKITRYIRYLWQYRLMMKNLTMQELRGRFKYTILGYLWHILNPLVLIIIYYVIFSVVFGRDITNYWAYLSTGMFAYSFFSSSLGGGTFAIVNNSRMITKMAFAREVLVLSKICTNTITLIVSYTLLLAIMLVAGIHITINILLLPIILIFFIIFTTGITFITSSINVYFRDTAQIVNLLITCLMFALPIFYIPTQISESYFSFIWYFDPLFYYIDCIHDVFFWGALPDTYSIIICILSGMVSIILGMLVFKKLEHGFAERL